MCPKCKKKKLERQVSLFSMTSGDKDEPGADMDFDPKMEQALDRVMQEAGNIDENDPRQAAQLMRKFADMTGMQFKGSVEEAISRMEAGEDPEAVEQEMGDMVDGEENPFEFISKVQRGSHKLPPQKDPKLYDL